MRDEEEFRTGVPGEENRNQEKFEIPCTKSKAGIIHFKGGLMNNSRASLPVILVIGSIVSTVLVTAILLVHVINSNFKPSLRNAERMMQKGRFEEALTFINQIDSNSSDFILLKAEILFLKALQSRKDEKWKNYGNDESDWFRSEEIDSAVVLLKKIAESEKGENFLRPVITWGRSMVRKDGFTKLKDSFKQCCRLTPIIKMQNLHSALCMRKYPGFRKRKVF